MVRGNEGDDGFLVARYLLILSVTTTHHDYKTVGYYQSISVVSSPYHVSVCLKSLKEYKYKIVVNSTRCGGSIGGGNRLITNTLTR